MKARADPAAGQWVGKPGCTRSRDVCVNQRSQIATGGEGGWV
jgi:hypothetical protein